MTIREFFAARGPAAGKTAGFPTVRDDLDYDAGHRRSTQADAPDRTPAGERSAMAFREFLETLQRLFYVVSAFLVVMTFAAWLNGTHPGIVNAITRKFDLRQEMNVATWTEGSMFLLVGVSYALIALSRNGIGVISPLTRLALITFAIGGCFLSMDEMLILHERVGMAIERRTGLFAGSEIANSGFSWLIPYAPALLLVAGVIAHRMWGLITGMRPPALRKRAIVALTIGFGAIPAILALEVIQGYLWYNGSHEGITSVFEEAAELVVLGGLYTANILIARSYDL